MCAQSSATKAWRLVCFKGISLELIRESAVSEGAALALGKTSQQLCFFCFFVPCHISPGHTTDPLKPNLCACPVAAQASLATIATPETIGEEVHGAVNESVRNEIGCQKNRPPQAFSVGVQGNTRLHRSISMLLRFPPIQLRVSSRPIHMCVRSARLGSQE